MGSSGSSRRNLKFFNFLKAGALAGIISAILNNGFAFVYQAYNHYYVEEYVNLANITILSIAACLAAGIGYFIIAKIKRKPGGLFTIIVLVLLVVSLIYPYRATFPDGTQKTNYEDFFWLTLPMHFITALCALYVIPANTKVSKVYR